jgi:hypothetical protein
MEIKNFQSSQEERQIAPLPPCETSHKSFWRPTKWKLWNFKIIKQKTLKIHKNKMLFTPKKKWKTTKMARRKLKS